MLLSNIVKTIYIFVSSKQMPDYRL